MGFRDWFVTAAHHREVCALYEQRLVVAADVATREHERANREIEIRRELETSLMEKLFEKPAVPEPRRVQRAPEDKITRVEVPLDINDEAAIIRQAARETRSRNGRVVAARAQHIRDQLARGKRVTRNAPLRMPMPEVQTLIEKTMAEAEAEAFEQSKIDAAAARHAAS